MTSSLFSTAGDSAGGALVAAVALRLRDEESVFRPAAQVLLYPWLQALDFHLPSYQQNNQYLVTRRAIAFCTVIYCNVSQKLILDMEENAHISSNTFEKFGEMIAPVANVFCWLYPTLNKIYLILSYLILSHSFLPSDMVGDDYKPHRSKVPDAVLSKELEECVTDPYNFPLMHDDLSDLPPAFILTEEFDVLRDEGVIYAKRLQSFDVNVTLINDLKGFHSMFNFMTESLVHKHAHHMTDEIIEFIKTAI